MRDPPGSPETLAIRETDANPEPVPESTIRPERGRPQGHFTRRVTQVRNDGSRIGTHFASADRMVSGFSGGFNPLKQIVVIIHICAWGEFFTSDIFHCR